MSKLTLNISGMTCASCVRRVEKALTSDAAVKEATVNLATEKATVNFDATQTNPVRLISLVKKAGYEASLEVPATSKKEESLHRLKIKILISALLTLPLSLPMVLHLFGGHFMLSPMTQLVLATPVQFYIGAPFYKGAWKALAAKTGNMDLLVALGTSAAYGLSLFLLYKQVPHLYFESSAMVITLVLLGKYFESRAKDQTKSAIKALQKLQPEMATLIKNGVEEKASVSQLKINDQLLVKPGERIPTDGIIYDGETQVDESLITGESLPKTKAIEDTVIGGSINGDSAIKIKVTALGAESTLARIIRLVEDAQAAKAPIQRLVDKVSAVFVPVVIAIALITLLATGLITHDWEKAIIQSVAVMVIACPCALGLATPTSIMVGTGVAAKRGILIKDAEALELAHSMTTIAFDKTGTLTEGQPTVSFLSPTDMSEIEFLKLLASIQAHSEHPLAKAVLMRAAEKGVSYSPSSSTKSISGIGVESIIENKKYYLGSKRIFHYLKIPSSDIPEGFMERESSGETISFIIRDEDKKIMGLVGFRDKVKENSPKAIQKLKSMNIKVVMLTGDNLGSAQHVAQQLHLDQFMAEVLPEDKAQAIADLKKDGDVLGMVGDGINDAPALAAADIGMAMSTGTDVAMHTAGITLMRGEPMLVADAISISRATYRKIKQNLFWAFIYNIIGIPLAALGYLNPMLAGAAMAFSSVSVVSNALLLKRWKAN